MSLSDTSGVKFRSETDLTTASIEREPEASAMQKTPLCLFLLMPLLLAQAPARPPRTFEEYCTICHGGDAHGTARRPSILPFVTSRSDPEITALVRGGRLDKGMPNFDFNDSEMTVLIAHLRGLASGEISPCGGTGGGGADRSNRTPRRLSFRMAARLRAPLPVPPCSVTRC